MSLHLERELARLKKRILHLGTLVEENLRRAVKSLLTREATLANEAIRNDPPIDEKEVEIEEECLKVLALHQPVANDLRFIVAVLKLNNDLERIGDLSVNIAERALFLAGHEPVDIPSDFAGMAQKVESMLKESLDALVNRDASLAREICEADDKIDAMNRVMYSTVQQAMRDHPEQLELLINLISASRNLERIADHATNIAEDVIYMTEGSIIRHTPNGHVARS